MNALQNATKELSVFWRKAQEGYDRSLLMLLSLLTLLLIGMIGWTYQMVNKEMPPLDMQILLGLWVAVGMVGAVGVIGKLVEMIMEVCERP